RRERVVLSPDLLGEGGFGSIRVDNSDGDIVVPADISLTTEPGGSITLLGANLDVEGQLSAPAGSISLSALQISANTLNRLNTLPGGNPQTPAPDPTRGHFTLGASASLSAVGLVVDDRAISPTAGEQPLLTNGGSVTIIGYSANLEEGSDIDVS